MKTPNKASFFISRYRRFSSGADRTRETDRPGGWAAVIWPARARHARVDETGYRTAIDRPRPAGRPLLHRLAVYVDASARSG
jgi:hypothetical protein